MIIIELKYNPHMKPMQLVRYQQFHFEPMLTLHRSARQGLEKLGLDVGISEYDEEADLRAIEQIYLQSGGECLIGLVDGAVIAMGGFQPLSNDSAELRRMRIRTDLQGQGYGSQLLLELERLAFRRGIRKLSFETAKARTLTLKFYRKHGYQETGFGYYGKIETVHFSKLLQSDANGGQTENDTWYQRVPKIELHLHLEGSIPHDTLWELIKKYGGEVSVPNREALENKFQYRDFPHFLKTWSWKNQFLREYDDFTFIAEAVARSLSNQNVLYAEAIFAPSDFFRHGLETQKLTRAIRAGLAQVPQIEIALVADPVRNDGPQNAERILAEINEVKHLGIVGITIGGSEQDYPPEPFADVYEKARRLGFHTSAHAGEAAGPASVWGAIRSLKVERIGHGTRAIEDKVLVDYIAEHRIPIEICPISNLKTGVIKAIGDHPVRQYFDKGIPISINTDDPKMFGNSLAEEYRLLETQFSFTREEIQQIILQGIDSSWQSEERKLQLVHNFLHHPEW